MGGSENFISLSFSLASKSFLAKFESILGPLADHLCTTTGTTWGRFGYNQGKELEIILGKLVDHLRTTQGFPGEHFGTNWLVGDNLNTNYKFILQLTTIALKINNQRSNVTPWPCAWATYSHDCPFLFAICNLSLHPTIERFQITFNLSLMLNFDLANCNFCSLVVSQSSAGDMLHVSL